MQKKRTALRSIITSVNSYAWLALVAVVLLGSLFIYHERHTNFVRDATTRQPQPYTELYFADPPRLPITATSGQTLPATFTIHNVEGRQVTYTYTINFTTAAGQTTVLSRHTITLAANAKQTISASAHILSSYNGRGEVGVILLHQPENIHYWVEVTS